MATLYKEVQAMVARIAKWRKMTYVVKVSNQPISGSNPNSVMAAMANTMVYADSRNDITNDVVYNLNRMYKATGGPSCKVPPTAPQLRPPRQRLRPPVPPSPTVASERRAYRQGGADDSGLARAVSIRVIRLPGRQDAASQLPVRREAVLEESVRDGPGPLNARGPPGGR